MNKGENITKKYFDEKTKNFVTKEYFDEKTKNLITKEYLDSKLDERFNSFKKSLITDLIKEERAMLHDALLESLENAKVYHERETEKYIKVLMDEWKDESRGFHDYMKGIKDTQETHNERISKLELSFG